MLRCKTQIINKLGLHARAAAKLVAVTTAFSSKIRIRKGGKEVDGKSIISILMLAASQGSELIIEAEGADEQASMEAIIHLIENRFEESE